MHRLGLPITAALASYALAIGTASVMSVVAAACATILVLLDVLLLHRAGAVAGPRPLPRAYDAVAALVALATFVLRGALDDWGAGATTGVSVLLAIAPGALLAATDVPLGRALRRGAPDGIVLRHTAALVAARGAGTVALDGVDTVADGMIVDRVDPLDETHLRNLRWFGGALAHALQTPLGRAIAKLSASGNLTNVARHAELGISGSVDRHPTRIGALQWIGLGAVDSPWEVVGVEVDGRPLGTITVADALRADTVEAVTKLRSEGLDVVLVAPASRRVDAVAARAGISAQATDVPQDAAVVSARATPARLLLGPCGDQISMVHADVGSALTALTLCRAADDAQRRSVRVALGWHGVAAVLAAVGALTAWPAGAAALVGTGVVWALARSRR
jgi:cation transport ATPase